VHSGNLIGINGGWAYMTEYRARTSKHGHLIYDHPYFSVVPLSSIQLLATGNSNYVNGECANWLAKTPASHSRPHAIELPKLLISRPRPEQAQPSAPGPPCL
jgi:hypothetical protein